MRHQRSRLLLASVVALLAPGLSAQEGSSTFGHARARELAALGRLPTAAEVVVRDIANYHRHRLPLPKAGEPIALDVRCDRSTAATGDEVWVQVGYTTAPLGDRALAAPAAVALVVDTSSSMADADKLAAAQRGLHAFADRLRADDELALVTFSTEGHLVAPLQRRGDGRWLHDAIDRLAVDGSTNLHQGLMLGFDELGKATARTPHRRVVVLTDGIANRGVTDPQAILADAQRRAETTIDISTIGVGQSLDVPLLQQLAAGCRGLFHFVADAEDVQKVFVAEADALVSVAARGLQLTIDCEPGLHVLQVLHEGARFDGGRVELDLPDANAGVTAVVLLRCRVDATTGQMRASARIRGRTAAAGADEAFQEHGTANVRVADAIVVERGDTLERIAARVPGDSRRAADLLAHNPGIDPKKLRIGQRLSLAAGPIDVEVRKNAAIAALAQGLADMAVQCDARRWADAARALQRAGDDAQRLFPGADDDVQRVRDLHAGHQQTLRRYVDRFREF